jgi:hypothetical protein
LGGLFHIHLLIKPRASHQKSVETGATLPTGIAPQAAIIVAFTIHSSPMVTNSFQHANIQNFFDYANFFAQ